MVQSCVSRVTAAILHAMAIGSVGCGRLGPAQTERDPQFNLPTPLAATAATGPTTIERGAVFDEIPGRAGSHAPTIAMLADGTVLAAWYSYVGPGELHGAAIYLARREPHAATWAAPILHAAGRPAYGNPVLFSHGHEIWLFYAVVPGTGWSTAHIEMQRSVDGGHTWTRPAGVGHPLGSNVRSPPLRLANGEFLLPAYDDLLSRALFLRSVDGSNWSVVGALTGPFEAAAIQPTVFQAADGRLVAVLRNSGGGWLWSAASEDEGRTWTGPYDSGFANPGSPAALLRLRSGQIVLVLNDSATERHPLSITVSADDGRTWLPPRVLVDGPGEYAYPALVESTDGRVEVLYSDDRQRIGHVSVNVERSKYPDVETGASGGA